VVVVDESVQRLVQCENDLCHATDSPPWFSRTFIIKITRSICSLLYVYILSSNSMSGFSWIANVHSPGLTEYKFNLTKDCKFNNSAR